MTCDNHAENSKSIDSCRMLKLKKEVLRFRSIREKKTFHRKGKRIDSVVMDSVIISTVVDRGFEPRPGQTKDYKMCICCFSAKHEAFRRKSKDWLTRNQDNCVRMGRHVYRLTVVSVNYHSRLQLSVLV